MWYLVLIISVHGHALAPGAVPGNEWQFPTLQECLSDGGARVSGWAEPGVHGAYTCRRRGETFAQLRKVRRPVIFF